MKKKTGVITSFKIDNKVKIDRGVKQNRRGIYPFQEMKVGDSFLFLPGTTIGAARSAAYSRCDGSKKFTVQMTQKGVRCFRIA